MSVRKYAATLLWCLIAWLCLEGNGRAASARYERAKAVGALRGNAWRRNFWMSTTDHNGILERRVTLDLAKRVGPD